MLITNLSSCWQIQKDEVRNEDSYTTIKGLVKIANTYQIRGKLWYRRKGTMKDDHSSCPINLDIVAIINFNPQLQLGVER